MKFDKNKNRNRNKKGNRKELTKILIQERRYPGKSEDIEKCVIHLIKMPQSNKNKRKKTRELGRKIIFYLINIA